ncbi:MAG: hypothetical protein WDO19_08605 [Bacteroidota bacterium]
MFYRINKKQKIKFELVAIERRVLDENAPVGGVLQPGSSKLPIALVPQDVPATAAIVKTTEVNTVAGIANRASVLQLADLAKAPAQVLTLPVFNTDQNFAIPLDGDTRAKALKEVDEQLIAKNLVDKAGKVTTETKQVIEFESEFSLPTAGIIVKGCLDECDICEPYVKERMQLENDLLRKQIDLLEKSQEYRCCPQPSVVTNV